jgi:malic enzyme
MASILDQLTKDEFTEMMDNVNASQLRVLLEAERKKKAELMAQVEQLQKLMTVWHDQAEHDAKVAKAAFIAGYNKCWNSVYGTQAPEYSSCSLSEQYANQLRQRANGGE